MRNKTFPIDPLNGLSMYIFVNLQLTHGLIIGEESGKAIERESFLPIGSRYRGHQESLSILLKI